MGSRHGPASLSQAYADWRAAQKEVAQLEHSLHAKAIDGGDISIEEMEAVCACTLKASRLLKVMLLEMGERAAQLSHRRISPGAPNIHTLDRSRPGTDVQP